jgi:hypothetical protein
MTPDLDLTKEWLKKSRHDLEAAHLLATQPPLRDTALVHCRQTAEKAVKGLLVFHDLGFSENQDIVALISAHLEELPQLRDWLPSAARLAPLACYETPGALPPPSARETAALLACADDMATGILRLLPEAIRREVGERTEE